MGSVNVFIADNFIENKRSVVAKKLRLVRLTSRSNLLSPFPFWPTDHSGANAFHHKTRRTSSCTRSGFHRSLTTILSRNSFGNQETHTILLYHDKKTTLTESKHVLPTLPGNITCTWWNSGTLETDRKRRKRTARILGI